MRCLNRGPESNWITCSEKSLPSVRSAWAIAGIDTLHSCSASRLLPISRITGLPPVLSSSLHSTLSLFPQVMQFMPPAAHCKLLHLRKPPELLHQQHLIYPRLPLA